MKLLTLWLVALVCGCSGPAAAQPRSSLGRASTHPEGVDGTISEREVTVTVDAQGRQTLRERRSWEFLTDYALDYHSDPEIWFDSARQTLDVARARTTQPDRTVTDTPESGRNDLLPHQLAEAPAYGSLRRAVITLVGVEPSGRAELDYTLADTKAVAWSPGGVVTLAGPLPQSKVTLGLRSERGTLRAACLRCEATPTRQGEALALELIAVPALDTYELGDHEGDNRWSRRDLPRVVWSTAESWEAEARALAERVEAAAVITEPIRARAGRLARDEASLWSGVEAVQAFLARSIDTIQLDLETLGFSPPPAAQVLARSYGSELDKAVLLVALLRALGVEAQVVLLSEESLISLETPWLGQLDHAWVVARAAGQERWMPVDRPLLLSPQELPGEQWALRLDRPGAPTRLEAATPLASAARLQVTASLTASHRLEGELRLSLGGLQNPYFQLRATGRGGEGLLAGVAESFSPSPDAVVDDVRVTQLGPEGSAVRGQLGVTLRPEAEGTLVAIPLPWPAPASFEGLALRESRQTPLTLEGPNVQSTRITLELPPGSRPAGLPSRVELRGEAGWLVQQVTVEGQRLEITRELGLSHRVYLPLGDYPGLRELLATAARLSREVILVTTGDEQ